MMTSRILKFLDFTKTQKSRYLESETWFFLQIKKLIKHQGLLYGKKNTFVMEVTFKGVQRNVNIFLFIFYVLILNLRL